MRETGAREGTRTLCYVIDSDAPRLSDSRANFGRFVRTRTGIAAFGGLGPIHLDDEPKMVVPVRLERILQVS